MINTLAGEPFCIHTFCNQKFFRWKSPISSFAGTASWDHEINPATLLVKFGFKMKNCLSSNIPILFQSLFPNLDNLFFIAWWIKCAGSKLFENMVAKQNHHSFASHSWHFLPDDAPCGLPWRAWRSFISEKKACAWGKKKINKGYL